jgi:hypothetical protein
MGIAGRERREAIGSVDASIDRAQNHYAPRKKRVVDIGQFVP